MVQELTDVSRLCFDTCFNTSLFDDLVRKDITHSRSVFTKVVRSVPETPLEMESTLSLNS